MSKLLEHVKKKLLSYYGKPLCARFHPPIKPIPRPPTLNHGAHLLTRAGEKVYCPRDPPTYTNSSPVLRVAKQTANFSTGLVCCSFCFAPFCRTFHYILILSTGSTATLINAGHRPHNHTIIKQHAVYPSVGGESETPHSRTNTQQRDRHTKSTKDGCQQDRKQEKPVIYCLFTYNFQMLSA